MTSAIPLDHLAARATERSGSKVARAVYRIRPAGDISLNTATQPATRRLRSQCVCLFLRCGLTESASVPGLAAKHSAVDLPFSIDSESGMADGNSKNQVRPSNVMVLL